MRLKLIQGGCSNSRKIYYYAEIDFRGEISYILENEGINKYFSIYGLSRGIEANQIIANLEGRDFVLRNSVPEHSCNPYKKRRLNPSECRTLEEELGKKLELRLIE